jgi:hypothetical protein
MGCAALMLRKDVEAHEDAALRQHNRLLLMKAKEQHRELGQVMKYHNVAMRELDVVKGAHDNLKVAHGLLKRAREGAVRELEEVKQAHDELEEEVEELRGQVGYEIVLRVKHAVLTGREPLVSQYPDCPTRLYSEDKVVEGHTVRIYVQTKNINTEDQDHYGVLLEVSDGPFPCKATFAFELVHHDGDPQSTVKWESEDTYTEAYAWGRSRFIHKALLASLFSNPFVKDGYVTLKCTVKIVNV